jgi:NAD(P)-dependent dehydrogenase (short-subunit alcohol dehydrogenase family)
VRVNAVGPGYIRTDLSADWLRQGDNEGWVRARTLLDRVGDPTDVVGAVLFLASDKASYVTGQHLLVDAGWTVT